MGKYYLCIKELPCISKKSKNTIIGEVYKHINTHGGVKSILFTDNYGNTYYTPIINDISEYFVEYSEYIDNKIKNIIE